MKTIFAFILLSPLAVAQTVTPKDTGPIEIGDLSTLLGRDVIFEIYEVSFGTPFCLEYRMTHDLLADGHEDSAVLETIGEATDGKCWSAGDARLIFKLAPWDKDGLAVTFGMNMTEGGRHSSTHPLEITGPVAGVAGGSGRELVLDADEFRRIQFWHITRRQDVLAQEPTTHRVTVDIRRRPNPNLRRGSMPRNQ